MRPTERKVHASDISMRGNCGKFLPLPVYEKALCQPYQFNRILDILLEILARMCFETLGIFSIFWVNSLHKTSSRDHLVFYSSLGTESDTH